MTQKTVASAAMTPSPDTHASRPSAEIARDHRFSRSRPGNWFSGSARFPARCLSTSAMPPLERSSSVS
eukprot:5882431-Pyramimonas_sp.AAC.1